jgi:hypothetical protein
MLSMSVGMVLPMAYGLLTSPKFPESGQRSFIDTSSTFLLFSWVFAWLLAGLFWGWIMGRNQKKKLTWGFLNALVYVCWGIAALKVGILLIAINDYPPEIRTSDLVGGILLVLISFAIGTGLNFRIFRSLIRNR